MRSCAVVRRTPNADACIWPRGFLLAPNPLQAHKQPSELILSTQHQLSPFTPCPCRIDIAVLTGEAAWDGCTSVPWSMTPDTGTRAIAAATSRTPPVDNHFPTFIFISVRSLGGFCRQIRPYVAAGLYITVGVSPAKRVNLGLGRPVRLVLARFGLRAAPSMIVDFRDVAIPSMPYLQAFELSEPGCLIAFSLSLSCCFNSPCMAPNSCQIKLLAHTAMRR